MEAGRGGACVPARVALQGRIHQRNVQTCFDMSMYRLCMEMPSLQVGNVPFADGNAAARTFGRAHRRRPYHFSYGSCYKIARE